MPPLLRRLVLAVGLLMLSGALTGCIIEDGGYHHHHHHHGWCWWPGC